MIETDKLRCRECDWKGKTQVIQPDELIITVSRLPDNSAFTVEATDRIMCVVQDNQDLQSVLNEVLWAIKHHNTLLERSQI